MGADVAGYCPVCGGSSLFLAAGGHVTCRRENCPNPAAADEILADHEIEHVVSFTESDFTVLHPLRERIDSALLACDLHSYCNSLSGPPVKPGKYRAIWTGTRWSWSAMPS